MSQGIPNNNSDLVNLRTVNDDEYRANLKRAEEAQAQLDHFKSMNEAAKKAYDKQQELLRKIQEGKEAEYASYIILVMGVAHRTFRRQLQALATPPSGSTSEAFDASKMAQISQPPLSTSVPLPKVPDKPVGTDLGAAVANVQAQFVNRMPSQSNPTSMLPQTERSSQETTPADIVASWQRFSQSIVNWAKTAHPSSAMPLINSKIKVVKDANSQVLVVIPGTDSRNPITMTLQALMASLPANSAKTSTHDQGTTVERPNKPDASDSRNGYRPYSVPQHQALQASAGSRALNMSNHNLENTASPARTAPSTPMESSAILSSSERTPSQANKKSLAKDILRALGFSSLKRSQPDDPSVMQAIEPPFKRHASGITSQTSDVADDILQASIEHVQSPPPTAATYPPQVAESNQATLTSAGSKPPVSSTKPSESTLLQSSNPQSTIAPNNSQPHASPIETASVTPTPQELPQSLSPNNDDLPSVNAKFFPERPTTPLFLPSLSSSPMTGASEEVPTDFNRNAVRHAQRSSRSFYVIVPPDPFWLKQYKAQQLRKKGQRLVGESKRESSGGEISSDKEASAGRHRRVEDDETEDEDNDVIDLDPANNLAADEFEREAILLSCSRIREQSCKWDSCHVILNSAEKHIRHLAYAHQELFEEFSVCRWQHCGQPASNWAKLFQHLKGHVLIPLRCAYQGVQASSLALIDAYLLKDCEESFRTPRQLVKHHRNAHRNDSFKPSNTPFVPTFKTPAPASPLVLPSYLMEPIQRPSMTKERHDSLGPWVLRQIAGPVNHEVKRYNAASKLLQSPSRSEKHSYQPYDFLSFPSANYSSAPSVPSKIRGMEDLNSGEVSDMVHNGLVLWGPQEEEDEDELSLPSSPLLQLGFRELEN
ncbi:hypothetical protein C0993_001342 [Termitomyces sp. T159_Od127]|nr:hypothetical protein C0993_001342 [Termitomyces sp. T159_Od127]